jgi:hypothetical protein
MEVGRVIDVSREVGVLVVDADAEPVRLAHASPSRSTTTSSGGTPKRTGIFEKPSPDETTRCRSSSITCP